MLAYKIYRCWVSEFQALPDLDANANAVAIQTLKLENEGWERDLDVVGARRAQLHRAGLIGGLRMPAPARSRDAEILDLWERGVGLDRWRRDDALLAVDAPPPRRLGARNAALLAVRNAHFDGAWPLQSSCPALWRRAASSTVDSAALRARPVG